MNKFLAISYGFLFPLAVLTVWFVSVGERSHLERRVMAVEQDNALLRSMVDQIPGGVWRISAPDGVITYANDGATALVGYTISEMVGHNLTSFDIAPDIKMHERMISDLHFHRDNSDRWIRRVGTVGHKSGSRHRRRVAIRPYYSIDGAPFWLVFVSPLIESEEVTAISP